MPPITRLQSGNNSLLRRLGYKPNVPHVNASTPTSKERSQTLAATATTSTIRDRTSSNLLPPQFPPPPHPQSQAMILMISANNLKPSMQILPALNSTFPHHQPALHCTRQQHTPLLQLGLLQQLHQQLWWLLYQLWQVSSKSYLLHHSSYQPSTTPYLNTRHHSQDNRSQDNISSSHQLQLHTSHLYLFKFLSKARLQPQPQHHHHAPT